MLHSASMLVAASTFMYLSVGGLALSIFPLANMNATTGLLEEAAFFRHDPSCQTVGDEDSESCDVAEKAQGSLAAQTSVRPIFVKFHKVGGTTLMELLNTFMGITTNCGRSCGDCFCLDEAKACTGHASRMVLQHVVMTAIHAAKHSKDSFLTAASPSIHTDFIPAEERHALFKKVHGVPLKWLPQDDKPKEKLLFITLLRNPMERLRSKYYFTRALKSEQESKHMSFVEWMHHMSDDHETCCEYVSAFGVGSVQTSKKVLASLFDVIGFTEEMDKVYVEVAKHFGVPEANLPTSISCRGNSENKENWTPDQLMVAQEVVAKDLEIYRFAQDLVRKRRHDARKNEQQA